MKNVNVKTPISVFIICKNEVDRISHAINSVKGWVDEIIVVDSGSADDTVAVAKALGADQVVFNEWQGYGPQKAFAEKLCKNDWILNLDADEECSPQMKEELLSIVNAPIAVASAFISVVRPLSRLSKDSSKLGPCADAIRLYNKKFAGFDTSIIHDSVRVHMGITGRLKSPLVHRPFRSYAHAVEKINFYSTLQAQDLFAKGREPGVVRIIIEPIWTFFKSYFINKYFLWGAEGLLEAFVYAFARTIRLVKAKELFLQKELQNEKNT